MLHSELGVSGLVRDWLGIVFINTIKLSQLLPSRTREDSVRVEGYDTAIIEISSSTLPKLSC